MIKTFKNIRLNLMVMLSMFLLLSNVQAQSIIFSSDQWPKRWERAMHKRVLSGEFRPGNNRSSNIRKASNQGWGQQQKEKRNKYSRTPDYYNNDVAKRFEADPLKQRYSVPQSLPYAGYGAYPGNGYYGTYPVMPLGVHPGTYSGAYPGIYSGAYPGLYQGFGGPGFGYGLPGMGFPYSSPFLLSPGLTPGLGYPW